MASTKHYAYRTTTDKLAEAMDDITCDGDTVLQAAFTGGRDWVLLCRKGMGLRQVPVALRHIGASELAALGPGLASVASFEDLLMEMQKTFDGLANDVARITKAVERSAQRGATMATRGRSGR